MKSKIKKIIPQCNINTLKDGRGGIFSFVPNKPIFEWTHQFINSGKIRGNHCHPEFDEYILIVNGNGVEIEKDIQTGEEVLHRLSKGECIYIPKNTYHVFIAITDCESVSFLTKKWDDCVKPIIHENLGHGEGDHGDPKSKFYK
ncbi:cupin domain-containing protein [Pelagibacteraceae bacterium]|nr:cupin domain-containing protein [Pelagibacteraceae bacterium]|tara:strand:+ start:87 stop:518 length:432 start_codon:yes stop_codon:yes gene_type:complete